MRQKKPNVECSVDGCDRIAQKRGMCRRHHYRVLHYGDPLGGAPERCTDHGAICAVDGCDKKHLSGGYCDKHYRRFRIYGDPLKGAVSKREGVCEADGCNRPIKSRRLCGTHYQRLRNSGSMDIERRAPGEGGISRKGYVILHKPDHPNAGRFGKIPEHRYVMSEHIGRPLEKDETVHHRNGVRNDNRIENLELWCGGHGNGGRVEDMLAWAREIIKRYGNETGIA